MILASLFGNLGQQANVSLRAIGLSARILRMSQLKAIENKQLVDVNVCMSTWGIERERDTERERQKDRERERIERWLQPSSGYVVDLFCAAIGRLMINCPPFTAEYKSEVLN